MSVRIRYGAWYLVGHAYAAGGLARDRAAAYERVPDGCRRCSSDARGSDRENAENASLCHLCKKYFMRNRAVAAHQPHKLEVGGSSPSSAIISVADETVIGEP